MERMSQGPVRAGWSGESTPQAKRQLSEHPSVGAADHDAPRHLFPKQGTCPGCSAMGRAPQRDHPYSALGVSGDTRDNLQASEDSWEMRRPDRAIRVTRRGGKSGCPEQGQLSGAGSCGKMLENIHAAPHERRPVRAAALDLFPSWR